MEPSINHLADSILIFQYCYVDQGECCYAKEAGRAAGGYDIVSNVYSTVKSIHFEVFRKIFINSKHEPHFNMMMGDFVINVGEESAEQEAKREIQLALKQAAASRNR
ncbi:hypothetical protein GCM10008025_18240 [Ornithinibacillus halotolerans]|uniref:Uncharacterized protein n=1 Tax=Ornithinibacillus halotolerans TaxID=1274357 RepID=A0A916W7E4_9BACI|nr:hypothetical protein GCM10008025_18240 [Ornithinibacillus halotolerans]